MDKSTKDLVVFYIYEDNDGYFENQIFENVVKLKKVFDEINEEAFLEYTQNDGYSDEISLSDIDSYEYVPHHSDLSRYIRSNARFDATWDSEGNFTEIILKRERNCD